MDIIHTMSELNTWKNDEYWDGNYKKAKIIQRVQFNLRERKRQWELEHIDVCSCGCGAVYIKK